MSRNSVHAAYDQHVPVGHCEYLEFGGGHHTHLFAEAESDAGPQLVCLVPFALAVLQGLGDLGGVDEVGAFEVGDGAADLQHAVIAAGREMMSGM